VWHVRESQSAQTVKAVPGKRGNEDLQLLPDLNRLICYGHPIVVQQRVGTFQFKSNKRIEFCRVDIYMKIWADLVVDLEVRPKGDTAMHRTLHANGGQVAWVGPVIVTQSKCAKHVHTRELIAL
jgi:hypothetical protein